jgi:hypothetical protein
VDVTASYTTAVRFIAGIKNPFSKKMNIRSLDASGGILKHGSTILPVKMIRQSSSRRSFYRLLCYTILKKFLSRPYWTYVKELVQYLSFTLITTIVIYDGVFYICN